MEAEIHGRSSSADREVTSGQLRVFAAACLAVSAWLGWRLWQGGSPRLALALWALGVAHLAAGAAYPSLWRATYRALVRITRPVGFVVAHVLLAVVFFAVVTPLGLVLRGLGRSPLDKGRPAGQPRWHPRAGARRPEDYLKPY